MRWCSRSCPSPSWPTTSQRLKFGAEIERSHVRSQYQPYGPEGFYIYMYDGVPYSQYSYSYDLEGNNKRTSAYAQDQWTVGRLTMNLGVRMDRIRGNSPVLDRDVYKPKTAWGPRLGLAFDVTGKGNTVLKGFWGRYYEGPATGFFSGATPGISDYTVASYNEDGTLSDREVLTPAFTFAMEDDIRHPRTDEFNVSFEQQLTQRLRFTASGIYRTNGNFISNTPEGALWSPFAIPNAYTGGTYTGYYWENQEETATNFTIQNVKGYQYRSPDGSVLYTADPERTYKALMFVLSQSFSRNYGFQVSYVLSKAEGNVDNTGYGNWLGGNGFASTWVSPNTALTNNVGELTNSRRHEIKVYASYRIPEIDVMLGLNYLGMSGRPYAPYEQLGFGALNIPSPASRRQVYLAQRGSLRNDFFHSLDLRAEKVFDVSGHRFGLYMDVDNLTNRAGVTSRNTRYPFTTIGGEEVQFGWPTALQTPRQITFGARWSF